MSPDWNAIEEKCARWRSLSNPPNPSLEHWIDVELTYTSNAVEGNTLTRIETAIVLEKGLTIAGKPLRDHLEAVGHLDALRFVRTLARRNEPLRETDIRDIHRLVMMRAGPEEAGKYASRQRFISGSTVVLPGPSEIPALMAEFAGWLGAAQPSPRTAIAAHEKLVTIHPFSDGNGRTARLLMNLLLLKADYPPLVVGPEHFADYLLGLETLQLGKGDAAYWSFMAARLDASIEQQIKMLAP